MWNKSEVMNIVYYDGYLTESKLKEVVGSIFQNTEILFNKPLPLTSFPKRFRYDIVIPEYNIAIEFDGYRHFQDYVTIKRDIHKDSVARYHGWKVIRIPYFVQLASNVIKELFDIEVESDVSFPHGFIDKKALRPLSFSVVGVMRFNLCLEDYQIVKDDILSTLEKEELKLLNMINIKVESVINEWQPYYIDKIKKGGI